MRWPWSSGAQKDPYSTSATAKQDDNTPSSSDVGSKFPERKLSSKNNRDWNSILNATDWTHFTEPRNLIPTVLLTSGILFSIHLHRRYLRRIPAVVDISSAHFRRRSLLGRVTSVGDGDNFRMYHTPGGKLAGWGWLPFRKVPTLKKELKDRTVWCFRFPLFLAASFSLSNLSPLLLTLKHPDPHPPRWH